MKKLRAAAVATNNWIGQPDRSISNMASWARRAAEQGAELIVFPELCVNGYVQSEYTWQVAETVPGPSTERLVALAEEVGAVLCYGILERVADIVYNTQVLVGPGGIIGKQQKVHMPGAEYLYWRGGFEVKTFDLGKVRAGITICYDSLFSELARTLFFKGAELLIMPFAYGTIDRSKFMEADMTALTYRVHCYSNGCWGIVVNNAGTRRKSKRGDRAKFPGWAGIIAPDGTLSEFTHQKGNSEAMVVGDLEPGKLAERRRNTYFVPRCLRPEMYRGIDETDL